jgi:hypothetical protein
MVERLLNFQNVLRASFCDTYTHILCIILVFFVFNEGSMNLKSDYVKRSRGSSDRHIQSQGLWPSRLPALLVNEQSGLIGRTSSKCWVWHFLCSRSSFHMCLETCPEPRLSLRDSTAKQFRQGQQKCGMELSAALVGLCEKSVISAPGTVLTINCTTVPIIVRHIETSRDQLEGFEFRLVRERL